MIEYLLATILILLTLIGYFFILKPKKEAEFYVKCFKAKGYRVLVIPFQPFTMSVFKQFKKNRSFGDEMKTFK